MNHKRRMFFLIIMYFSCYSLGNSLCDCSHGYRCTVGNSSGIVGNVSGVALVTGCN